jgi:hypothetical protein
MSAVQTRYVSGSTSFDAPPATVDPVGTAGACADSSGGHPSCHTGSIIKADRNPVNNKTRQPQRANAATTPTPRERQERQLQRRARELGYELNKVEAVSLPLVE